MSRRMSDIMQYSNSNDFSISKSQYICIKMNISFMALMIAYNLLFSGNVLCSCSRPLPRQRRPQRREIQELSQRGSQEYLMQTCHFMVIYSPGVDGVQRDEATHQGKLDRCLVNGQFNREGFGFLFLIYKHNLDKGPTFLTTHRGMMCVSCHFYPRAQEHPSTTTSRWQLCEGQTIDITDLANFKVQVWSKFRNLFLLT